MPIISEMFAFVVADTGPEDEGVLGFRLPNGDWMPMVGADMARIKDLIPIADKISKTTGKPYTIKRFILTGTLDPEDVSRPG